MRSPNTRTFTGGEDDGRPSAEGVLVLSEEDETSEAGDTGDVLVESVAEVFADVIEGYPSSPPVLDEDGGVLAAFEVVSLESAKLCFLEDVVVGGGGMGPSEIDLPSALVGGVSKERDVHREPAEKASGMGVSKRSRDSESEREARTSRARRVLAPAT